MRAAMPRLITVTLLALTLALRPTWAAGVSVGPVQKAIALLGELQTKLIQDGEVEQANFEEFSRFCERTSIEKQNTIKDHSNTLQASADTAASNIGEMTALVEQLTGEIS